MPCGIRKRYVIYVEVQYSFKYNLSKQLRIWKPVTKELFNQQFFYSFSKVQKFVLATGGFTLSSLQ